MGTLVLMTSTSGASHHTAVPNQETSGPTSRTDPSRWKHIPPDDAPSLRPSTFWSYGRSYTKSLCRTCSALNPQTVATWSTGGTTEFSGRMAVKRFRGRICTTISLGFAARKTQGDGIIGYFKSQRNGSCDYLLRLSTSLEFSTNFTKDPF